MVPGSKLRSCPRGSVGKKRPACSRESRPHPSPRAVGRLCPKGAAQLLLVGVGHVVTSVSGLNKGSAGCTVAEISGLERMCKVGKLYSNARLPLESSFRCEIGPR